MLYCPAAYNFDNAPITPTTAPVPIIAPRDIAAGPIAVSYTHLIQKYGGDKYEFSIRETKTFEIIDDVKNLRSEIGIIYLSNYNKSVLQKIIRESNLKFLDVYKRQMY